MATQLCASGVPAASVEVTVVWGTTVLTVWRATPPRPFCVGEEADFAVSEAQLGASRRELVTVREGRPCLLVGANDSWQVFEGEASVAPERAGTEHAPSDGQRMIPIFDGRRVVLHVAALTFHVAGLEAPERVPRVLLERADRPAAVAFGASALLQSALIASLAYFTPALGLAGEDELSQERLYLMQQYLRSNAEREREPEPSQSEAGNPGEKSAPASAPPGDPGRSGRVHAPSVSRRFGIEGKAAERVLSRAELVREATDFGTIGLVSAMNASTAPSSPFGADVALGMDAANAHGDLFGGEFGDAAGSGLTLSGIGESGGNSGPSVGIGGIGTCGSYGCSGLDGTANSMGRLARTHVTSAPKVRMGAVQTSGRLPPEVVQRIVRQNYGRFRLCYEVGLRQNPNLSGRVTTRFVIARDGSVSNASAAGGDLGSAQVASCVASSFYALSFPVPDGGIVTVSYPIVFSPG